MKLLLLMMDLSLNESTQMLEVATKANDVSVEKRRSRGLEGGLSGKWNEVLKNDLLVY